ncbi:hypothetical protein V8V91_25465 [Algoriphagus halophilus]|uniref:hypothetical protein n=1 Tax=Algoriphagus halophilus TaxID=226505 RepID=UPI00358EC3FD
MKKIHILTLLTITVALFAFVDNRENDGKLLFESQIGPVNSKITVQVFDLNLNKAELEKTMQIDLVNQGIVIFRDTLMIQMNDEPLIDLIEINGDGIKDLRIEYLRPGRGGNNVSMAYLYNAKNMRLDKISNSIYFPNLSFDEQLKSIYSFRFYGGFAVQMDYLEIVSDTLSPRHQIIKEEQIIYIKKYINGKWIDRKELKLNSDDIIIPEVIELEPEIKIKNAS